MPGILDNDPNDLFVGIGTLLNHKLPKSSRKHIFGSGFGYGAVPVVDDKWKVYAVRGPLTAKILNIDPKYIITDSAILISKVEEPVHNTSGDKGFMPHYASVRLADWQNMAEDCGLRYISPEWPVPKVLEELKKCNVLFTEAMHGAIVADALRLPWHPLILGEYVNLDKWTDWLATLNIQYLPTKIDPIYNAEIGFSLRNRTKNEIKRILTPLGFGATFHPPPPRNSSGKARDKTRLQLINCTKNGAHFMSSSSIHANLLLKYSETLKQFISHHEKRFIS
jgi:succinoglycan biosynthesis protein ExoV